MLTDTLTKRFEKYEYGPPTNSQQLPETSIFLRFKMNC